VSIIKDFFGEDSLTDDKYMANTMLTSAKATATAYLAATLESATPELRHLYSGFCTQVTQSHESLTGLAITKGWYNAYGDPTGQLKEAVNDSLKVISPNA